MKIVIDISEEDFDIIKHNVKCNNPLSPMSQECVMTMIADGTSLQKVLENFKVEIAHEIERLGVGSFYYYGLKYANEIVDNHISGRENDEC